MKVKVIKQAWYKQSLLEIGKVIDYDGYEIPSWATLASGEHVAEFGQKNVSKNPDKKDELPPLVQIELEDDPESDKNETTNDLYSTDDGRSTSEENFNPSQENLKNVQKEKLDKLRDVAVANEIWLKNLPEDITIDEEIAMLECELKVKGLLKE